MASWTLLTSISEYPCVSPSFWQVCCHSSSSSLCIGNLPGIIIPRPGPASGTDQLGEQDNQNIPRLCFHSQKISAAILVHLIVRSLIQHTLTAQHMLQTASFNLTLSVLVQRLGRASARLEACDTDSKFSRPIWAFCASTCAV